MVQKCWHGSEVRTYCYLLSVLLPGEESSGHEETVQTSEIKPAQGGEAREEGQQRGLCYTASRQGQALQLRAETQTHLTQRRERQVGRTERKKKRRELKEKKINSWKCSKHGHTLKKE